MDLPSSSLQLLGTFQLISQGRQVAVGQPRLEALIARLAIHPDAPVPRQQIAYEFWPDSTEKQARVNLRNLLYKLKRAWPNWRDAIAIEAGDIIWRADSGILVDVHRLGSARSEAAQSKDGDASVALLTEAVDLYCGDFLPTCFEEWALTERERLFGEYAALLERLVDALLDQRRAEEALPRAKTLLRLDPLRESAYRRLMQVYAALGDRADALRVYHTCASILQHELGVEPSPATEKLRMQLLQLQDVPSTEDAPQSVQRQQLVGRHQEWQQLRDAWRQAQHGRAVSVLLWGEAGIGKTRLAEELIDWVRRQGQHWASSRSYAVEGALTYAPIADWLRAPSIQPALKEIDDLWRVELARLLPNLLAERPDLPAPGPLTESWQQQRFFQSIAQALQTVPAPLLLHLDDLQWADAETLTLLQFLLHHMRSHPLLIVGGIRTEDAVGNTALASFVENLRHSGQLTEVDLTRLSHGEAAALAQQVLGEALPPNVAEWLFETSEGHPLFLIETVHSGLVEDPPPARTVTAGVDSGISGVSQMPPKIYNLIAARLNQLSDRVREVVSLAAVIGRAFTYAVLHDATGLDELSLIDALDELWARRLVREQGSDAYDFSHDRIREVAYHEISQARRRLYHRRVAHALESVHHDELDEVAGELATQYAQAGDSAAAFPFYRRAASSALAQYALPQAKMLLDATLRHAPDDPALRVELLQDQGRIFNRLLQFQRWKENLDAQQALLASMAQPDPRLLMAYEVSCSRYSDRMNELNEAARSAKRAIALAETIGDDVQIALGYLELGDRYWRQARMAEASHAFAQAAVFAHRAGDRVIEAKVFGYQVQAGMYSGMPSEQQFDLLTRALAVTEATDDRGQMANLYLKLAYLRFTVGMGGFEQVEQDFQRVLDLANECGDRQRASIALSTLGLSHINRGNYRRAEACFRDSVRIEHEEQDYWRNWVTLHYRGRLHMQMGALDRARDELVRASEQLHAIDNHHYELVARSDLGLLYHLDSDNRAAQSALEQALALAESQGDLRHEALACTRLGYVLEAVGQLDEARRLHERGQRLHDEMGQHYYAMNALAGLARLAFLQGDNDGALVHVTAVWKRIGGQEMDATVETTRTLRICYTILDAQGDPRASAVVAMAWDQLQHRVSTITDSASVEQFWQIEDHRFFRALVEGD